MPDIAHDGFGPEEDIRLYVLTERATWRLIHERHVVWDNDERQDFVSDTYTYRILPQRERLYGRPEPSQQAFIYQAVKWAYSDKMQWQGKQPQLLKDNTKLEFLPRAGRAPDPATALEADDAIVKALVLADLSKYEQEVYLLSEVEGRSYTEIAEHLGKSKAAIRTALCRAVEKMEEFLLNQETLSAKV